jgi:outer membrane immunogenic protein
MRLKLGVGLIILMLLLAMTVARSDAQAQQVPLPRVAPSVELTYAYTHTNGPPGSCGCFGLNGGGASFVYPLRRSQFSLIGHVDGAYAGGLGNAGYDFKLFTYTSGARYIPKLKPKLIEPYGEVLAGISHAGGSVAKGDNIGTAFAGVVGGGVNLRISHHFAIKLAQADYLATTFANGGTNHQNDFRISTGIVFFPRH